MFRYQYRKLWWRPSKRDNLEETKMEIDSLLETSQNKQLDETELTWLGFGSSPLMVPAILAILNNAIFEFSLTIFNILGFL